MKTDTYLCLSAQHALYGAVGPNLVRFTGEIQDKTITLQWIVLEHADEDEIEDYRVVGTEVIAAYVDEMIDEQFLTVAHPQDAKTIRPLSNRFFCSNLQTESE